MSRKIQQQFLLSKGNNKIKPIPVKINDRKIKRVEINLNNSFSNEFSSMPTEDTDEENNNNLLAQSYSFNPINKHRQKIMNEPSNIILESILYSKQNGGKKNLNKKIKFITRKDVSDIFIKLLNKNKESDEEYLKLRNIVLNENDIKDLFKDNFDQKNLEKLHEQIVNLKFSLNTHFTSNNVNPIISLKRLFEEINLTNLNNISLNYNEKYNKLFPFIYRVRKIKGDGNCYYRAVMFKYMEQIILSKNLILLKKLILEMNQAFKSKEIQDRLHIKMDVNFKPNLHLKIMFLILSLLEKGQIKESYELFIKSVLSCAVFDFGLILYFRYILYLYIQNNEKKVYTKSFPVKIGNFLPAKYENENGEFDFKKFYTNFLLKMFTEAEKIIIYLTPFVLGINLDVIIFEDNEDKVVKRFSYEEENGENKMNNNVITLLNRNAHYELVYTYDDYNKYSEFYKNCEIFDVDNVDKNLGNSCDDNFYLFQSNNPNFKRRIITDIIQPINNNNNKTSINKNSNVKTIIIKKKLKTSTKIIPNQINNEDNGSHNNKDINDKNKIIENKLVNIDNNENNNEIKNSININKENGNEVKKSINIKNENNKGIKNSINIEFNNTRPKVKVKKENQIPFGHPEYKADNSLILNYLDKIDNMFLNNLPCIECLKCKKKKEKLILDKYEFCDNCLKSEIISVLANDYLNYLKTENLKKKKYKITSIILDKYSLTINDILDILEKYTDVFIEKDLYLFVKKFVCISCFKYIDEKNDSRVLFPCGCAVCNKNELEKYFTEQNYILSDNYTCICGYKFQPKDFYALAEVCNKIGCEGICFLIINIFYKDILSKGCCGCGSKNKFKEIKYSVEKSDDNEFFFEEYLKSSKINLVHNFCESCEKKYKNQKFFCSFCNKIHLYIGQ